MIGKNMDSRDVHVSCAMYYSLFKIGLQGMNIGFNAGNLETSGETNVLRVLQNSLFADKDRKKIIFDVGANIGLYTKLVKEYLPDSQVYAFEPSKKAFARLQEVVKAYPDVAACNIAFSDSCGEATLYYDCEGSTLSSLYKRNLNNHQIDFSQNEAVNVSTINDYCNKVGIKDLALLKLDVEGNEYKALLGADRFINEKKIKCIQIEFGGCNIDSRTFFKDFWELLSEKYNVYRIMRDGFWQITRYTEKLEIFDIQIFLFILKEIDDNLPVYNKEE